LDSRFARVRAVLFDLDDTLCNYWDASKAGMRQAFAECGLESETFARHWATAFQMFGREVKSPEWYKKYLLQGEPTRTEQMRRTLACAGMDDEALAVRLSYLYAEYRYANLRLFPDAERCLQSLIGRFPLGLITNGPADIQREEIAVLGLSDAFDNVYIEGEQGIGKPDPHSFRAAERDLGLKPDELVFIGNSFGHDVVPAMEAGWLGVWIRRPSDIAPSRTTPEEMPVGATPPDLTITSLDELLPLLTGPS